MNTELRRQVLLCFKQLHRTRLEVFHADKAALIAARKRINDEFVKNRNISSADTIKELITFGNQVEEVLRKNVVQAIKKDDATYTAKIRKNTALLENMEYQEMPESMIGPFRRKGKCSNQEGKDS